MSFNFVEKVMTIGGTGSEVPTLQFYKKGFIIGGGKVEPTWRDVILSGVGSLTLANAKANGLNYVKLFGATEQRNLPSEYTQVNYITNTAKTWLDTGVKFDFSKNYEIELRASGTLSSWYILQAREDASAPIHGISGSMNNQNIILAFNGSQAATTQITRINGNIYYIKGIINNGNLTLYVKDETAGTEETVTGTYTVSTGQSVNIGLLGNNVRAATPQSVDINTDVYFARIKEDGNYIMNYVSCRQGVTAGFYDKASNTFKTTNDLVADGNTVPSPEIPMDIICNNGTVKVSKNLFDYKYFYDNYMVPSTSTVGRVAIKLSPNTNYTVSTNTQQSSSAAQVWTASGSDPNAFSPVTTTNGVLVNSPRTIQSDSNGYIILALRVETDYELKESDFENGTVWVQIEQGSTATPYMPYGQIYTDGTVETVEVDTSGDTANAEMLLQVGDYKDEQTVLDGNVTRNVGIKALDGTENWDNLDGYFNILKTDIGSSSTVLPRSSLDILCTHYKVQTSITGDLFINVGGSYVNFKDTTILSLAAWKAYLENQYNAGTPVIVVYPLANATTETVTPQPLSIQAGTNIITAEGSIEDLELEVSYKGKI